MANYVYIEEGIIKEYHDKLPNSWKNISGFNHLAGNLAALISYGWYPVEKNHSAINPAEAKVTGYTYEILSNKVIETATIHYYTEAELNEINLSARLGFFDILRELRNDKLRETDWTQMIDLQENKSQTWKDKWKNYRQALRDLPQNLENTTSYDINDVTWPSIPTE